jgi:hypothetical protein
MKSNTGTSCLGCSRSACSRSTFRRTGAQNHPEAISGSRLHWLQPLPCPSPSVVTDLLRQGLDFGCMSKWSDFSARAVPSDLYPCLLSAGATSTPWGDIGSSFCLICKLLPYLGQRTSYAAMRAYRNVPGSERGEGYHSRGSTSSVRQCIYLPQDTNMRLEPQASI